MISQRVGVLQTILLCTLLSDLEEENASIRPSHDWPLQTVSCLLCNPPAVAVHTRHKSHVTTRERRGLPLAVRGSNESRGFEPPDSKLAVSEVFHNSTNYWDASIPIGFAIIRQSSPIPPTARAVTRPRRISSQSHFSPGIFAAPRRPETPSFNSG